MPRSAWDIVLERRTPKHVHNCPVCYGKFPCTLDCTIEYQRDEDDGTPMGAYCCCSLDCAALNDEYLAEAYGHAVLPTPYREPPPEQLALPCVTRK